MKSIAHIFSRYRELKATREFKEAMDSMTPEDAVSFAG